MKKKEESLNQKEKERKNKEFYDFLREKKATTGLNKLGEWFLKNENEDTGKRISEKDMRYILK